MKRNLLPLLAVAFAVAIASTGIFYGLFVGKLKGAPTQTVITAARALPAGTSVAPADLTKIEWTGASVPTGMYTDSEQIVGKTLLQPIDQGEPVLASRLISKTSGGPGVPAGMRAVSVHVSDSSGVLGLLRPGYKVDVQVFAQRPTTQGPEGTARTAFQNITVLAMSAQAEPSSQGNFNAPVVTLLVNPVEADALGLADSYGRIRLALRNPIDDGKSVKGTLPLTALFRGGSIGYEPGSTVQTAARVSAPTARPVSVNTQVPVRTHVGLNVQLMSASPEAIGKLKRYGLTGKVDTLDASQISQPAELDKILAQLREDKSVDVLSLSRINAAVSRSASVELQGRNSGALKVQFSPFLANGLMKLRVQPEMTTSAGASPGTRKLETEVDISSGRSFFISGLRDDTAPMAGGRQLLVLVTPNP